MNHAESGYESGSNQVELHFDSLLQDQVDKGYDTVSTNRTKPSESGLPLTYDFVNLLNSTKSADELDLV